MSFLSPRALLRDSTTHLLGGRNWRACVLPAALLVCQALAQGPIPVTLPAAPPLTFSTRAEADLLRTGNVFGGHGHYVDTAGLDTAVQTVSATALAFKPPTQNLPGVSAFAVWRPSVGRLATQVDSTGLVLLLAPLRNDTGGQVDFLTVTYRMSSTANTEFLKGHRLYWSRTGLAGGWVPLGDRMMYPPGADVPVSLFLNALAWPSGTTAYLLWVDDNGHDVDGSYTVDELAFDPAPGPRLAITTPVPGAGVGPEFVVEAEALAPDASIRQVSYYYGVSTTPLASRSLAPYRYAVSGFAPGQHVLTAVVLDSLNRTSTSMPVTVTVSADSGPLLRGPYLQQAGPDRMTVRWRGSRSVPGRVCFGRAPDQLSQVVSESRAPDFPYDHEVALTGLSPGATYWYSVGSARDVLAAGPDFTFTTPPPPGTEKETRIWVMGDAGYGGQGGEQILVRDAFYAWTGARTPDFVLQLGDNAYRFGTDANYQSAMFDVFPGLLRKIPFWSCLGNHDAEDVHVFSDVYPYFSIYSFPTAGECGGVASGSEHYYSFDYANIHFISLDSMTANRSASGPMATWLRQDLASTTAPWIICLFHHPPYSKGSHDSDSDAGQTEMRENIVPILEAGGVDLVLSGHSHSYERSHLLDGHYGLSSTLDPSMILDAGGGRESGSGPYRKPASGPRDHAGAVYIVAGSASEHVPADLNHPAHFVSLDVLGTVGLTINGSRLDATFVQSDGATPDSFTIVKQGAADRDGDGIPDAYELEQGTDRHDHLDALLDLDLDGCDNLLEYHFDTNPQVFDQYSLSIAPLPQGESVALTFDTSPGRTYCVHSSNDLLTWEPCSGLMVGTGSPVTWVDPRVEAAASAPASGQPARYFYRVGITMDP